MSRQDLHALHAQAARELLEEWDAALWPLTPEEQVSAWKNLAGWLIGTAADRPDEVRRGFIGAVAHARAKHGGQQ